MILSEELTEKLNAEILRQYESNTADLLDTSTNVNTDEQIPLVNETTPHFKAEAKRSEDTVPKAVFLEWWVYVLLVIFVFLVCLLLNYIVKKINESRLEERLSRMMTKDTLGLPVENAAYTKKQTTRKMSDTQQPISMIFTKEDNNRMRAPHTKPRKYSRDKNGHVANKFASDWINKGIKLAPSDIFKNVTNTKAKDLNSTVDPKSSQDTNASMPLSMLNSNSIVINEIQKVTDKREVLPIVEEVIETLINNSSMSTNNEKKNISENTVKNVESREKLSVNSENSESLFQKFLGVIYKINILKSKSDLKKPKENNESTEKQLISNSGIKVGIAESTSITETADENVLNASENKMAIIDDSNYILLENSDIITEPSDFINHEITDEGDKKIVNIPENSGPSGNGQLVIAENSYKIKVPVHCVDSNCISERSTVTIDKPSKLSELVKKMSSFLSDIVIDSNTSVEEEPVPKNSATFVNIDVENQNLLNKRVLSKDDVCNETLMTTHNFEEDATSKILDAVSISDFNKSININIETIHENLCTKSNELRKSTFVSSVFSETKPRSFFNDLTISPAEYSIRKIASEKINSDMELKSTQSNLAEISNE